MKKNKTFFPCRTVITVILLLVCALQSTAYADGSQLSGNDAISAVMNTGDNRFIEIPDESCCLSEFKTMYIAKLDYDWCTATKIDDIDDLKDYQKACGPAVPVERVPEPRSGRRHMPWAYEGTEVTVVAENNDMACIIYLSSDNEMRAGWVQKRFLVDRFPGKVLKTGVNERTDADTIKYVESTWSRKGFLDSLQNYSVLNQAVKNCVGFTLDYQLIEENTSNWSAIFGPRTIYINDGQEWVKVGVFEYPEHGTVKVNVSMSEPTDIVAIGTIAEVSLPNTFRFRQSCSDFLVVSD